MAVRVRPPVAREEAEGAAQCLEVDEADRCVTAAGSGHAQARRFTFDHVYGPDAGPVSNTARSSMWLLLVLFRGGR